ncbi:MAG: M20 metallopeptidase family protein [Solirubrobacterales bacterium]
MFEDIITRKSEEIKEMLIKIRRDIHKHPEIGLHETRTAAIIADILREYDIPVETEVGVTGVVGTLQGKYPGKTILLRADMDCLKITEENDLDFKSIYPEYMHACGHDAHTTWLIGAAIILSSLKDELHGNVKFLFQPAEEREGGAEKTIHSGVLENPKVDIVVGAHNWPGVASGKVGVKSGPLMAATDNFKITILGRGGHGAQPQKCIDPIAVACEVYMAFQTIISRKTDPLEPVVLSIGKFNAGTAHNIIPDNAYLEGTIRTLSFETREKIPGIMEEILRGITEANGANYEFDFIPYHPPVINNEEVTSLCARAAGRIIGENNVVILEKPTMVGEDFSSFEERVPGTFIFVGNRNEEKGITYPLHTPEFAVDEEIIHKTAAILSEIAILYLNSK